jgi:chromosome segregation ATPase
MTTEPSWKNIYVSVDLSSKIKVESYDEDGTVHFEKEKKSEEKLLERARWIDFTKQKEEKTESETTKKATEWIWSKVDENIVRARAEIEQIIAILDLLQKNEHLTLMPLIKPPSSHKTQCAELVYEIAATQKRLEMTANKMSQAAERLRQSIKRTHQYFEQVQSLRKNWKIVGPTQLITRYKPFFSC